MTFSEWKICRVIGCMSLYESAENNYKSQLWILHFYRAHAWLWNMLDYGTYHMQDWQKSIAKKKKKKKKKA